MSNQLNVSDVSGVGVILEVSATQPGFLLEVEAVPIDVPLAPELDGGSRFGEFTLAILFPPTPEEYVTRYEWLLEGAPIDPASATAISLESGTLFSFSGDQTDKVFLVRAVNAAGPGPYSSQIIIDPNA